MDQRRQLCAGDIRYLLTSRNYVRLARRPKPLRAWRAIARVFQSGGVHRIGDLAEVLRFIWNFDRINRPLIDAERIAHGPAVPVRRLTNGREIAAFLSDD